MQTGTETTHAGYVASLSSGEKLLIDIRDELYEGKWEQMKEHLQNRLRDKPVPDESHMPQLFQRVTNDLESVIKMEAYEIRYGVNLADYIPQPTESGSSQ